MLRTFSVRATALLIRASSIAGCVLLAAGTARGQLPIVTLAALQPPGGQVGTTFDLTVSSVVDGDGIDRLLFSHPGIQAVPKMQPTPLGDGKSDPVPNTFVVTVAADVPPGAYDARVAGTFGVSNPKTFVVDTLKEAVEAANNNGAATASAVEVGSVVNGSVAANGEDWFKFTAKKDQRVLIDVAGQRIDSKIDATLVVYDAEKRELARSRDVNRRDPLVDLAIPADGEYLVKLYDFTYGGGPDYYYRLAVHSQPYVDFVFPPVVRTGSKNKLTVFGRNLPGGKKAEGVTVLGRPLDRLDVEIDVPADEPTERRAAPSLVRSSESLIDAREYRLKSSAGSSNAVALGYAADPIVVEQEPNDTIEQSQKVTIPCEFVGQFTPRGDTDAVTFDAKKGEIVAMEVISQRMGFTADPFVVVQSVKKDAMGKVTLNDVKELDDETKSAGGVAFDSATNDPYYLFTAPEDGTYRVMLRDLYGDGRGDPRLIYRLALRKPRPDFRVAVLPLGIGIDKNNNGQAYKQLGTYIRAGEVGAITAVVVRTDGFTGEVRVKVDGLPAGVTAAESVVGTGIDLAMISIAVPEGQAAWCGPVTVSGVATIDGKEIKRTARAASITGPGNQRKPADSRLARDLTLSLGGNDKLACTIVLGSGKPLTVERGAKLEIPIKVTRRGDFKDPLTLAAIGLPQNVKAANVTIAANASDGKLVVETAANSPLGDFTLLASTQLKVNYARDKSGADAATARVKDLEKSVAAITAKADEAKKAAAAAPKEKKADADKAAAAAAESAKQAAAYLKTLQTQATAKMTAAAPKAINNIPNVSTHVVVRVTEPPKKEEKKK
jgi:hypothetical protein